MLDFITSINPVKAAAVAAVTLVVGGVTWYAVKKYREEPKK
jgi:hypothetical protein